MCFKKVIMSATAFVAISLSGSAIAADVPENIRNKAVEIDSWLLLSESDSGELIVGKIRNKNESENDDVRRFIWDSVQIINCDSIMNEYGSIGFEFTDLENTEIFTAGYDGLGDFYTEYVGPSSDSEVSRYFDAYYRGVFGAHDSVVRFEKQIYETGKEGVSFPEQYNNGMMWVFKYFGYDCGYETKGDRISVTILGTDTEESGEEVKKLFTEAMADFAVSKRSDPEAMPYAGYRVEVLDTESRKSLLVLSQNVLADKIENVEASGSGKFLEGFKK